MLLFIIGLNLFSQSFNLSKDKSDKYFLEANVDNVDFAKYFTFIAAKKSYEAKEISLSTLLITTIDALSIVNPLFLEPVVSFAYSLIDEDKNQIVFDNLKNELKDVCNLKIEENISNVPEMDKIISTCNEVLSKSGESRGDPYKRSGGICGINCSVSYPSF